MKFKTAIILSLVGGWIMLSSLWSLLTGFEQGNCFLFIVGIFQASVGCCLMILSLALDSKEASP